MPIIKAPLSTSGSVSAGSLLTSAAVGADLVSNGSFTSNAAGWTLGTGWTWGGSRVDHAAGTASALSQDIAGIVAGRSYQLTFTCGTTSAGSITPTLGTAPASRPISQSSTAGTVVFTMTVIVVANASGTQTLSFSATSAQVGYVDTVSLKEITPVPPQLILTTTAGVPLGGVLLDSLRNVAIGAGTGSMLSTGADCTAIGYATLGLGSTGSQNTAIGSRALPSLTTATGNTAVGALAAGNFATGNFNTVIGAQAGNLMTNGVADNVIVGALAGIGVAGSRNIAIGRDAGRYFSNDNVAIGYGCMYTAPIASTNDCTAVGSSALNNNTASGLTAFGRVALAGNTTGTGNTGIGQYAGQTNSTSGNLTAVGSYALSSATGADNTAVGAGAGRPNQATNATNGTTTGARQTLIGSLASQASDTQRNDVVALGYAAKVDGNNAIAIGSGVSANAAGAVAIGKDSGGTSATTTTQDEIRLGTALHTVKLLGSLVRPVVTKTAAYTLTVADWLVLADATTAGFTLTLPTAVGIGGRRYEIKRISAGANIVTINTTSSQTIDGATSVTLDLQYQSFTVVSDNANWVVI